MSEHENQPTPEQHEGPTIDHPRIWVGSLSDYNAGRLLGDWIDADREPGEIWSDITAMLARSHEEGAEEHAIFDHDNFMGVDIDEYESIENVSVIARGVSEHGAAYAAYVRHLDRADWPEQLDRFEDHYLGWYESIKDLGEEMADAHGIEATLDELLPEFIRPYVQIDYQQFGEDVASPCAVVDDHGGGGVYLFDT